MRKYFEKSYLTGHTNSLAKKSTVSRQYFINDKNIILAIKKTSQ